MDTDLPRPALVAAAPVNLEPADSIAEAAPPSHERITAKINSVLFYGLLAFGMGFPVIATIYALIVY